MPKTDPKSTDRRDPKAPDDKPFEPRVILELGKRYLGKYKWLIVAYIVATIVCRPLLPIAVGLNLSQLTNFFQQEQASAHQSSAAGSQSPRKSISPTVARPLN